MKDSFERVAFASLLLLCIVGVFSLPAFPSQDGPVHSYMAWVFTRLVEGSTPLSRDFAIKSFLPPYATLNYLIIFLQRFLHPLRAEQVIVCIYIVVLAFGFRRFAHTLYPNRSAATLLVFAFIFNTVVFQGLYNFCIGLGLFFWAAAFWIDCGRRRPAANAAAYAVTVILLGATHPVPLLFLVGFLALSLLWWTLGETRLRGGLKGALGVLLGKYRLQLYLFLAATLPCFYVATFIEPGPAGSGSLSVDVVGRFMGLAMFDHIMPFFSPKPFVLMLGVTLIVLMLVGLAARQQRETSMNPNFWPVLLIGAGTLAIYVVIPREIAGEDTDIAIRLPLFAFLMLLAAACRAEAPRSAGWPFRAGMLLLLLPMLGGIHRNTSPQTAIPIGLLKAPAGPPGARALIVPTAEPAASLNSPGLRFSPCVWGPAYYLQRTEAVLENLNWLGMPYFLLKFRDDAEFHHWSQLELSKFLFTGPSEPVAALPPEVDIVMSYQCRTGDATLPPGETITARYGVEKVWAGEGLAIYAKPGWLNAPGR